MKKRGTNGTEADWNIGKKRIGGQRPRPITRSSRRSRRLGPRTAALCAALLLVLTGLGAGMTAEPVWAAGDRPSIEMTFDEGAVVGGAQQRNLTLTVKNAVFSTLQFQIQYDPAKLRPSDVGSNEATDDLLATITPIAPLYNSREGTGWVNVVGDSVDPSEGSMALTIYADGESKGAPDGSDEDGFITADETGVAIMSFSFRVTGELAGDSLSLQEGRGLPTGILLVSKNETMVNDIEGLTNGSMVTINGTQQPDTGDEHNSGVPKDETDGNEGGGSPGGVVVPGGGTGTGGTGGTTGGTGTGSAPGTGGFGPSGETTGTGTQTGTPGGQGQSRTLTDVSGHWARSAIEKLVEKGVAAGYPDGTFRPEAGLTRGEFAQILYKGLSLPLPEHLSLPFADTEGHWSKTAVAAVYYGGYAAGTEKNQFGVEDPITREQLVTILCRAKGLEPLSGAALAAEDPFVDDGLIAEWAKGYVYAARKEGLLSGYEDGRFGPGRGMTRGEMAWLMAQAMN